MTTSSSRKVRIASPNGDWVGAYCGMQVALFLQQSFCSQGSPYDISPGPKRLFIQFLKRRER